MVRGVRRPFLRSGWAVLWVVAPVVVASCAKVWGIDDGLPYPDAAASGDAPGDGTLAQDNAVEAPADTGEDVGDAGDAESAAAEEAGDAEGGTDAGCDVDNNWCVSHCGSGPNNCGVTTGCSACFPGDGIFCDASTNQCDCTFDPAWCAHRCGNATDNCGNAVTCDAGCGAGACVPDGGSTCSGMSCGSGTDSCGNPVNCGSGGTIYCADGGLCDGGQCCQPISNPCNGFCNQAPNGCGGSVNCPSSCPPGENCNANDTCTCPTPGCGGAQCGTVTNVCGSTSGLCGTCTSPASCQNNQCICPTPSCGAAQCGTITNGCGSTSPSCGTCATGNCVNNVCQGCSCAPGQCGTITTSCGSTICPGCDGGEQCNQGTNSCFCPPATCPGGTFCGPFTNGCGNQTTCTCAVGTCGAGTCCALSSQPCGGTGLSCCPGSGLACISGVCTPVSEGGPPEGGSGDGGSCVLFGNVCTGFPPCCSGTCTPSINPDGGGGSSHCQ
ncbi:MAG TPA: hypothetical protein VIF09_18455 [Polyangiaceae bacterium]